MFTPRFTDLVSMLEATLRERADRPAFGVRRAEGGVWDWITWAQFGALVDAARAGFASLGIAKGDRVGVISNNRLEWVVGDFACIGLGAAYVPMYEQQLDKEWKYILEDCSAKVCVVSTAAIRDRVRAFAPGMPVVCFDGDGPDSWKALLENGRRKPIPSLHPAGSDLAKLVYTSGTTGNPKGVRLTHANFAVTIQSALSSFPVSPDDRSLAFLPWAHVAGGASELHAVIALGGSTAICERVDLLLTSLPEVKPTFLLAVPRVWNKIYDGVHKNVATKPAPIRWIFRHGVAGAKKARRGERLSLAERIAVPLARTFVFKKILAKFGGRLKYALSGAAALSPEVAEFIDVLGIPVYEGYGLTESSSGCCGNRPDAKRIGSVGKPYPGIRIVLDHEAEGADKESGEGEILIYGHAVMAGYHGLPEESARALTPDGGLRTGDLGRFDADGFLFVTGRVKELYKLENGKYVAPAPLEEKITLSPYIAQAMLHGANRPCNVALIVPDLAAVKEWAVNNGISTDAAMLLAHPRTRDLLAAEIEKCSTGFKGYERVRGFVIAAEELSTANDMLTPKLTVKRRNVLTKYGKDLEALYLDPAVLNASVC